MSRSRLLVISAAVLLAQTAVVRADGMFDWVHGDWYLTVGASGISAPDFEGASSRSFKIAPIVSMGKVGPEARFVSRNDNISFSLYDSSAIRAGVTGKFIWGRDSSDHVDTAGMRDVKLGGEAGAFVEAYPTDWMRVRAEVRRGIRSHDGVVADVAADAFVDVTDTIRVSAGPRASFASKGYMNAWYGVNAAESAASGLAQYDPSGGLKSIGVGGAVTWKTTDRLTTSAFGEYSRLQGAAADSSLVRQRGSRDQLMFGVSATYKFDFKL
jgi:outer membrane protein